MDMPALVYVAEDLTRQLLHHLDVWRVDVFCLYQEQLPIAFKAGHYLYKNRGG